MAAWVRYPLSPAVTHSLPLACSFMSVQHLGRNTNLPREGPYAHKSLRYVPFRLGSCMQAIALIGVIDSSLLWKMPDLFRWHSHAVQALLWLANVPWQPGGSVKVLPGITTTLLRTGVLSYSAHPWYPAITFGSVAAFYFLGYRLWPVPLRLLLFLAPAVLGATFLRLRFWSHSLPYRPEDFWMLWCRNEACLWLLLPAMFSIAFGLLNLPFWLKFVCVLVPSFLSVLWSAIRLALSLATFHYMGSIWVPFFYFVVGILADFLLVLSCYSISLDQAAKWLFGRKEVWN